MTDTSHEEIEAVRARLRERGLLATRPTAPPAETLFPSVRVRPRQADWDELQELAERKSVRPRALATPPPTRSRRKTLVVVATIVMVVAVVCVGAVHLAAPNASTGATVACAHFDRVRHGIAVGTLTASRVSAEVAALEREATTAPAPVARAFADLRGAGAPGSTAFLFARTAAADACASALSTVH
jgi:hypothetical protein